LYIEAEDGYVPNIWRLHFYFWKNALTNAISQRIGRNDRGIQDVWSKLRIRYDHSGSAFQYRSILFLSWNACPER
jgi:hypothetical protein